jgi:5-hydroxyisourate hydrolase
MATKDTNISTHVLDTAKGVPALALQLELFACSNTLEFDGKGEMIWQALGLTATDNDGRAKFIFDIQPGIYKMVFYTMDYFAQQGTPNFYPKIEIIFRIADTVRHHHIPLLLSPYGYSTYRGS